MLTIRLPQDVRDQFSAACAADKTTASAAIRAFIDRMVAVHNAKPGSILAGTCLLEAPSYNHTGGRDGVVSAGARITVRAGKRPGDPARIEVKTRDIGNGWETWSANYIGSIECLLDFVQDLTEADEELGYNAIWELLNRARARWDADDRQSAFYGSAEKTFSVQDIGAVVE